MLGGDYLGGVKPAGTGELSLVIPVLFCGSARRQFFPMGDNPANERAGFVNVCGATALRLVAASVWHVVRRRCFTDFPQVLTFVTTVAQAAPELMPYREVAKLQMGLKAKIIMNMLREDDSPSIIYNAMDTYFPENEPPFLHYKATAEDLAMVRTCQENFRVLLFCILSDFVQREIYVQVFMETDYGEAFMIMLEQLLQDYLCQLERILPDPEYQVLLQAAIIHIPDHLTEPCTAILTEYFNAVRFQQARYAEPLSSSVPPSHSTPCQNEDEDSYMPSPLSPQPGSISPQPGSFSSGITEGVLPGHISETG
ncbi:TERF1-interacting nuclear factor 2 isoform X2 [Erythrolamprus reginae]|uniref:TERF1-interacting nuclear factor 2 isoform X2 n=1 Tax=Erythrolamprus reginae TaxID=121349 RepID=UPI00396CA70B